MIQIFLENSPCSHKLISFTSPRYEKSSGGWHAWEKREEMSEDAAWYLIACDTNTQKPIAFSHFRFDMDYGDEVLYW